MVHRRKIADNRDVKVKETILLERLYNKEAILEHWKEMCQDFDNNISMGHIAEKYGLEYNTVRSAFKNSTVYQIWKKRKDKGECGHCVTRKEELK